MKKGLDAYKLKMIALVFMLLDHVKTYLSYPTYAYLGWPRWPEFIGMITRFVSPLFLYLMIEGFYHTRSRRKYLTRLFAAAVIMWCGNILINLIFRNVNSSTGKYSFFSLISGHNIFLTLAVLFVFICCLENIKERKKIIPNCLLAIITALSACILEGGLYLLPVALILWLFRNRKPLQCAGIALWSTALLVHTLIS